MPGMETAGNRYVDRTDIMMMTLAMTMMMTIVTLNQTSGTFRDQPNSRGAFLSSDCLDKPEQVPLDCIAGQLDNLSLSLFTVISILSPFLFYFNTFLREVALFHFHFHFSER